MSRRNSSSFIAAPISSTRPVGRMLIEPGEEARHRRAIANMRGACACDLGCVLDRLWQNAGVVAGDDLGAGGLENLREAHRRRVRIEAHARRLLAKRRKPSRQIIWRKKLGGVLEMPPHIAADLGGVDEQRRLAARRHQGKGERERGMADVAAADVEQPGDGIEQRQQDRVGLLAPQGVLQLGDLLLRASSRRAPDHAG